MCGIAGYVDFASGAPSAAVLRGMVGALRRRGPDAEGMLVDGPCGLAHTRLSIIDVVGSPQPMTVPGGDVSLVFNGELYNFMALRRELEKEGAAFKTQGDTEVLLRWVAKEWHAALPRFDGMFGFGAWDAREERLLLARDPIGEKPLFYATPSPTLIVFGSEVKAVLEHPEVDDGLDEDALRQALRFRAVYGHRSLHRGVRQLEPGTYLEFSRGGLRLDRYYDLIVETDRAQSELRGLTDEQTIARGQELLTESIRNRLIADVPVGAFLSGGLDSSIIVAIMRHLRRPDGTVRTFSVGFNGDPHSELHYAQTVAHAIGTDHVEVHVSESEYAGRLSELTGCRDAPISEPADVAIAQMSRVARQYVKVVLSGEGADEVFAGYPKHAFAAAPHLLRAGLRLLGPDRAANVARLIGLDHRRALVACRALVLPRELDRVVQWFSYVDREQLRSLLPGLDWSNETWADTIDAQEAALERVPGGTPLMRMQTVDCLTWLPGNMLERGDRMTMAEGLEARPPFLDRKLAPFGLALPHHLKIRGRIGKWMVRRWAANLLPPEIVKRKKWGFRVPLAQWFRGHMRGMLFDYLMSSRGLCAQYGDRKAVLDLLECHDSERVDANLSLWTLLSAEIWYQDVFRTRVGRQREVELSLGLAR